MKFKFKLSVYIISIFSKTQDYDYSAADKLACYSLPSWSVMVAGAWTELHILVNHASTKTHQHELLEACSRHRLLATICHGSQP
jgi:hypothetical protein